jgi:DNA polymerase, archaea type
VEEAVGISTEIESHDWITFLPMADGSGAYNRYFGRLSGGEIMGVMARKVDTPEYIKRIQMDLFDISLGQRIVRIFMGQSRRLRRSSRGMLQN